MGQGPKALANYFLAWAEEDGPALTERDLHDLVLAAHVTSHQVFAVPFVGEAFHTRRPDGPVTLSMETELRGRRGGR